VQAVARPKIRAREIREEDIPSVICLLQMGFADRAAHFWPRVFARLRGRSCPAHLPQFGYLLECDGRIVGTLLLICSTVPHGKGITTRGNVSSWYVQPQFRSYAPLLVAKALSHKEVTYLNVTAAPHTRPILEAQGYSCYAKGTFIAVPAAQFRNGDSAIAIFPDRDLRTDEVDPVLKQMMADHEQFGCMSLWCRHDDEFFPFIFRPRLVKGIIPCVQLVYCRSIDDFVKLSVPLGRYLIARARPFVVIDANAPLPGVVGIYVEGRMPRYFKGPCRPSLGDLAYTEIPVLGV
jgi:hypothetical protein